MGVKSSARARFVVVAGVEVEGVRRDSRDGTEGLGAGVGVGVGVDADRIERP